MNNEYKEFEALPQEMSADIGELVGALSKAQGVISGAIKDSTNPFFKSNYADLAAVIASARKPLSDNGLAVIQTTEPDPDGVLVVTLLGHTSGQWIRGRLRMRPTKNDPQGIGSCITYARRYAYAAIVGIAQVDDDANAASGGQINGKPVNEKKVTAQADLARELVDEDDEENGPPKAKELYAGLANDERILFQTLLKKTTPQGTRKTYWSCFKDHLMIQAEREKNAA